MFFIYFFIFGVIFSEASGGEQYNIITENRDIGSYTRIGTSRIPTITGCVLHCYDNGNCVRVAVLEEGGGKQCVLLKNKVEKRGSKKKSGGGKNVTIIEKIGKKQMFEAPIITSVIASVKTKKCDNNTISDKVSTSLKTTTNEPLTTSIKPTPTPDVQCAVDHYLNQSGHCVKVEQLFTAVIAFTEQYDQAFKDTNSQKFKDQAKKIEEALLPPIQAKIPQVIAIKVLALIEGSTVAKIDMMLKPGTVKGAVKATDVTTQLPNALKEVNVPGLTPKPNQKIIVFEKVNMALNKPSNQSKTAPYNGKPNDAFTGNDGLLTTRSYTIGTAVSWWMVDMQKFVQIYRIELYLWPWDFKMNFYGELSITTRLQERYSWELCLKLGVPKTLNNTLTCESKTTARYLKISSEKSSEGLTLREVEVYGTVIIPVNMALNKPSNQSKTAAYNGKPNHAFTGNDGYLSTRSYTIGTAVSWWMVDMQKIVQIYRIELYLWPWDFKMNFYGELSITTRLQERYSWELCLKLGVPKTLNNTLTCESKTTARYLKISSEKSSEGLTLREVEVYGTLIIPVNMALNKPSNQSKTATYNGKPNDAFTGNDGLLTTRSYTIGTAVSWWMVDMQKFVQIYHIELYLWPWDFKMNFYGELSITTRLQERYSWELCLKLGVPKALNNTLTCDSKTTARYLKISSEKSSEGLTLTEVEVYGTVIIPVNMALNKPSNQSKTAPYNGKPNDAFTGNDGLLTTRSYTIGTAVSWWMVDMLKFVQIYHIELYLWPWDFKMNFYGELNITTRVQESLSWDLCLKLGVPKALNNTLTCDSKTTARYLMISSEKSLEGLTLREVEVYGTIIIPVNMALNKPSNQSKTAPYNDKPNDAFTGNDGYLSTRSYTIGTAVSWWMVDMQKLVQIYHIELYLWPWDFKMNFYGELNITTRLQESYSWDLCLKLGVPKALNNTLTCDSKTTARYLKISSEKSSEGLTLREVEVYGTVIIPVNVALNKPSNQSKTAPYNGKPNDAFTGNDGYLSTRSYTTGTAVSWWMVDMQKFVQIYRIELYLWPWDFKMNFYGELSITTRLQESYSWDLCLKLGVPKALNNTLTCDSKTTARYLKISSEKSSEGLTLREVEVYGTYM